MEGTVTECRPGGLHYVELRARSAFSFLEGSALPEELAGRCAQYQQPAMGIVDRNGVYGAVRFHMASFCTDTAAHVIYTLSRPDGLPVRLTAKPRPRGR